MSSPSQPASPPASSAGSLQSRLLLSFGVATFIAALASVWVLSDVRRRLDGLESRPDAATGRPVRAAPDLPRAAGGAFPPARPVAEGANVDPATCNDPLVKLNYLLTKLDETSDNGYDYYNDVTSDLVAVKREIRQLKSVVQNIAKALQRGRPGGLSLGWGLAKRGTPLGSEVAKAYVEDAKEHGIEVEPGRVTARALLNLSPNRQMPIEYFITRYPESGHETLVHLIGARSLDDVGKDPMHALHGLGSVLYKALVAAGFREGEPSHADPDATDPRRAKWLLPTGDTVYLYLRYTRAGTQHLARATDWVTDPSTGTVLPEDCFRFTGSVRIEDPESGEEMLASELGGLLVSVWPNATALLEVALDSAEHNDYQYNSARIPKPDGEGPLLLDLIFSKTPLAPEGDGAIPLPPPQPPPPAAPAPLAPAEPVAPSER